MTQNANDLTIKVRLDTTQAKQEWKKQRDEAEGLGKSAQFGVANMMAKGTAGLLAYIFGESAAQSWGNIQAVGSNLGRTTMLGQQVEKDTARRNAWESAKAQTAEMFGPFGRTADRDQIMSIFSALYGFEKRDQLGKQRVESLIDARATDQTIRDVAYMLDNFGAVMKQFFGGFVDGRPTIR